MAAFPLRYCKLYQDNYAVVLFAIRSVVKDQDESMDLLQDTFVKAFNSLEQLKDPDKFTPWVKQIAVNNALQYVKKKRPILFSQMQSSEADSEWNVEDSFQEESREGLPDVEIDRKETERLIGEILDTLPEDQRIVINLFYFEQMSAKEIADEIGASVTLVNTRLALGRKRVEKKVLEMEKRGTKLYGLAPIPFLLLLFKNMDVKASEITPDPNSLTFILNHMHETGFPGHAPGDHHTSFGGNGLGGADAVAGAVHAKIALLTLVKAALSLG